MAGQNPITPVELSSSSVSPDLLLQAFLRESSDRQAELRFERLFLALQGQIARDIGSLRQSGMEREDLVQWIGIKLWRVLEKQRLAKNFKLQRIRPYVNTITRSVLIDKGPRSEAKEYSLLLRKVRLLFSLKYLDSPFAFLIENGMASYGLKSWYDQPEKLQCQPGKPTASEGNSLTELRAFLHDRAPASNFEKDLPRLVYLLLTWYDAPMRMVELMDWLARVLEITQMQFISENELRNEEGEISEANVGITSDTPETALVEQDTLRSAFKALSPRDQLVLLLALEREEASQMLGETTAKPHLIQLLEQSENRDPKSAGAYGETMWKRLALDDGEIADFFHTNRATVQVMRSRARVRLQKEIFAIYNDPS